MSAEARLKQLGLVLPNLPSPMANYVPFRLAGNLLYLSGQGPRDDKGNAQTGKVGAEVSVEEAYRRARTIAGVVEAHLKARGFQVGRAYALYPIGMGKTQLLPKNGLSVDDWRKACRRIELSFRGKGVGHGYDGERAN